MASEQLHGFDTADLTRKFEAKPSKGEASLPSEGIDNKRLFLISRSTSKTNEATRNRKNVSFSDEVSFNGKKYRVNSAKSGLYREILSRLIAQFEIATIKWQRLFVLRFDLHTKTYTEDNKQITAFRKRLFQRLKRTYGVKQIGFCWVREMERSKSQHYHWVIFIDGNLIRHSGRINKIIKECWEDGSDNYHVPIIKNPYYFGTKEQISEDVIYRISYLAKARGKGYRSSQAKDYQTSRLK
ncbi:YagK/YfjJ domain-containing protein [Methylophaga sp.]|uniref:YagK/YfjJ domain-containing protein n=1 Tax=Methylophaga sp. TaxID=2024840 RepID=UPI003A953684